MRFSTLYKTAALVLILVLIGSNLIVPGGDDTMYSRFEDAETDPNAPGIDSDGDGLKDILEDINRNGLIDGSEDYPTDPYNPDTDSDGIEDGVEFEYWSERRIDKINIPNWIMRYSDGLEEAILTLEALSPYSDLDRDGIINLLDPDSVGLGFNGEADPNHPPASQSLPLRSLFGREVLALGDIKSDLGLLRECAGQPPTVVLPHVHLQPHGNVELPVIVALDAPHV